MSVFAILNFLVCPSFLVFPSFLGFAFIYIINIISQLTLSVKYAVAATAVTAVTAQLLQNHNEANGQTKGKEHDDV